jgi:2-polyprenyl-3-methyl-5-hydroxy-6-metoxy-1,4-benzoquinol methylase
MLGTYSGPGAVKLCEQYESVEFRRVHECWLPLKRLYASAALDIGCGSGRDADGLTKLGFSVLAVDSSAEMLRQAKVLHPNPRIEWLLDSLPELALVLQKDREFDLILLSAVWMHIPVPQRSCAMRNLTKLCTENGILVISLRYPADTSRGMTDASCEEIASLASQTRLEVRQTFNTHDVLGRTEVTWSFVVLTKCQHRIALS